MSQFHPHSCLFAYESLIITTAKIILVLNEQTYKPSSPYFPSVPPPFEIRQPPKTLYSHLTYFRVQNECSLERKARYWCCFPSPVLICCSLMLPSHLSHWAPREYCQWVFATHAECGKVVHGTAQNDLPSCLCCDYSKLKVKIWPWWLKKVPPTHKIKGRNSTSTPMCKQKSEIWHRVIGRHVVRDHVVGCSCLRERWGEAFRFNGAEWGWHSLTQTHKHTHTGKEFDRAAARTGQLCSSDSTGQCLINSQKYTQMWQIQIRHKAEITHLIMQLFGQDLNHETQSGKTAFYVE